MKFKKLIPVLLLAVTFTSLYSQKRVYNLPEIPGFVLLKCDFHSHTVFSDGTVWPTYRLDEAWRDGLDALAITDHIEYQPKKKYIPTDHNAAWDIVSQRAIERNIILVKGTEITRDMPPGHFNALFIKDASLIAKDSLMDAIGEAISQGAFIQWNHPGWRGQQPDGIPRMYPVHLELLKKGWIHGIEFFNEMEFYPLVMDWCKEYKLSVMANSDVHDVITELYPSNEFTHRPMTLVFARERSSESLKQAMFDRKTVAWFDDHLAGPEELVSEMFYRSVVVSKPFFENEKSTFIEIRNNSDIAYTLINGAEGTPATIKLPANTVTRVVLKKGTKFPLKYDVKNLLIGSDKILKIHLK